MIDKEVIQKLERLVQLSLTNRLRDYDYRLFITRHGQAILDELKRLDILDPIPKTISLGGDD